MKYSNNKNYINVSKFMVSKKQKYQLKKTLLTEQKHNADNIYLELVCFGNENLVRDLNLNFINSCHRYNRINNRNEQNILINCRN